MTEESKEVRDEEKLVVYNVWGGGVYVRVYTCYTSRNIPPDPQNLFTFITGNDLWVPFSFVRVLLVVLFTVSHVLGNGFLIRSVFTILR